MSEGEHLHDGYPQTLRLLDALVGRRIDQERLGYCPVGHGVVVDSDAMVDGPPSATEVAVVQIGRGCAIVEGAGGLPPHLAGVVAEVMQALA
jgi:hypothetical protein